MDTVCSELVSPLISLLTGNLQGILAIFGTYELIWPYFMGPVQRFGYQIPCPAEQGIVSPGTRRKQVLREANEGIFWFEPRCSVPTFDGWGLD